MDVGSGSGYLTVCFAKMVGNTGAVLGIDHIKEVRKFFFIIFYSEANVNFILISI